MGMLRQGGSGYQAAPYIEQPAQPKRNILPSVVSAGGAALNIAKMNKKIQDDIITRTGILENPDLKYEWSIPGGEDTPEYLNVLGYKDPTKPNLFKSAGEQIGFQSEAVGKPIPRHIRTKYGFADNAYCNAKNTRKVMEASGKYDEKFIREVLGDRNVKGVNIMPEVFQKNLKGAVTKGIEEGITPLKAGKAFWKESGGKPFFQMPTNIEAAKTVAGGTDIGGPMSQIFKAFGQTKAKGGPGLFKFLMPGAEAAGTTLGGATGTAGTVGGAGAGLFAGMTPIGWTMMALGMIPVLKKLFK